MTTIIIRVIVIIASERGNIKRRILKMIKSKEEYNLLKKINFKYNKYYVSNIRVKTKTALLEAIKLNLKINVYDGLMEKWSILNPIQIQSGGKI